MENCKTVNYSGTVNVMQGNPPQLYEHQMDAMANLNQIDKKSQFNSLLVLPTGGGKTLTAAWWLLKNVVDKKKKVLWIAHRHLLLEQAADTFQRTAYTDLLIHRTNFNFRIVSGKHDRPIHIKNTDDVLIVSKDSIIRNLDLLNAWLKGEEEIYVVIDEAHHATAKSYRRILNYIRSNTNKVKLLGLTATPFRAAEDEEGLLAKIFTDDIVYKIDLKDLIKRGILARPEFSECNTDFTISETLGLDDVRSIEMLDNLPEDIANEIASNKIRNAKIVQEYVEKQEKYGQTLIFALNRMHAFALHGLFEKQNISSEVIVSGTTAEFIGIDISSAENQKNIEAYRKGEIKILINVNILTEGVDLPKTQTVFLTRPTVSSVLMTQMVGRALRGEKAGGTAVAYVVSFIDNWKDSIAWANAESLIQNESDFLDKDSNYKKKQLRLISIAKLEEFAKIIDESVDTSLLDSIDFIEKIPLGMYAFSFIDDNKMERNHQILIYNSTKDQYEDMIAALPKLFQEFDIEDEILESADLNNLSEICEETYFCGDMIPTYDAKDIQYLIKYFAQKDCKPQFIPFDQLDRDKLNLNTIAKTIQEKDMRQSEKKAYIENLWNDDSGIIRIYFNKKLFFTRQLENELNKLEGFWNDSPATGNIIGEIRSLETMTLEEIRRAFPQKEKEIRDNVFNQYKNEKGNYYCAQCGKTSNIKALFQIDHIKPMAKGGLTELENLQLLCQICNKVKSDKI